jgi:ADP-heptose:LPS heptosyltransferase
MVMDYDLIESLRPTWTAGMTGDHLSIWPAEASKCEALLNCAVSVSLQDPPVHEFEAQLHLLKALGAQAQDADDIWPECWTTAQDATKARTWISGTDKEKPLLVWAPCGSWPIRDWNTMGYQQVFAALPECTLVLVGTKRDAKFAAAMDWTGLGHIRRINLLGKTSINEVAAVVRQADLVLSAESAVFHLAAALRRPVICLAGGGHWGRFVPWGLPDRTRILTQKMQCFGCGWICTRPTVECIQGIAPEKVGRYAHELLAQERCDEVVPHGIKHTKI